MPSYSYKARDRKGALISGQLDADTRAAVSARLQTMGYFPIEIRGDAPEKKAGGTPAAGWGAQLRAFWDEAARPRVRSQDLTAFYRQMSDLIGAGIPLVKALAIVRDQMPNPTLARILATLSSDVQGGDTFARAMDKHPQVFSKLTVALVKAGETGGLLNDVLARVADYAEAQDELRAKVKSAMAYPIVMMFVGGAAVAIMMLYVMPRVLAIFKELDQALPGPTQFLINLTDFLHSYGWMVGLGLVAAVFLVARYIKTEKGAYQYQLALLRVPRLGDMILKREIAAFTRTLGSLLQNGVPILNALSIASEVMTNRPIRTEVEKIPEGITQGSGMAPTLRGSRLFPPVVVNMVNVGEETGNLPHVLLRVARAYEIEVDRAVKTLTSFIEPAIILILGLVVGFIVFAMLLPIFSIDPTGGM